MPQLDKYIFVHQLISLIFFFFLLYFYVRGTAIPKLNSVLKYRKKKIEKLLKHDKGNWKLFNDSNLYYSWLSVIYLRLINDKLNYILNSYFKLLNIQFKFTTINSNISKNIVSEIESINFSDWKRSVYLKS